MAKKSSRKVKNRSKSTNRNSGFFVASEVNVNPVNRTFLPDDTVARISTDDWWEDISMPGYASKRNLLRKLQEDDLYDDTRIVTSPFTNWWSHVGSRNLPDHLPREHKISVSPTLPDVPATPEIQHFGRRIPQERFDNMWDEKTEDLSSNPRTIKNARGSVLQKPKPNLESCATENILEREQHHSDSGNLSEHSLLYTSKDFTNRIRKQKGSRSIRRRKENYQKKALLNNIKKIELPDQNGSYESKQGHGSESESVKTHKIQLSKLMSCENNSISYPNVTDTYNNSLPERAQKTGRFDDAFKDGTVSITNEDLHLSQNSNKILSDLSSVTDIKGRLLLSSPNTKDMKRARKQRNLLHVSWSGQIDPNNSNVQNRRNITSLLDMTNPSIRNEFESKEPPKNGLKYLQGFLDVSNEDKLSEVNYKQTGKKDECTFLSKMNFKPKRTQEQFLNIEDLNEIPSEKLLTQLSHSEHKVLTKMSSLSDGSDSELPLPRSTSFRFSSSPQSTRDTSVGNVPTVSKVKSKFLQNLLHDTSICDSLSAESTTGTGKKLILSRASRNAKRGLISDKLLALSDVSENSKEKDNETMLEEVETTLKNSRRDSSATENVHADMKSKFTKSLAMTDLLTKQSAALHVQEENKSFIDTSQLCGSKNLNKLQHSKNYDTETELPNLQLGTSVLREVTENSKGSSFLENRREAIHGVLESNNSRRDLSASEKERARKTKGSRLHNITDSRSKLQQSLQDLSRHDISKEISSKLHHDPEITHEDVSTSEPKVNNRSSVFSETGKEKQVHFESNEHSDQEASKSLMGDKQVPKRRSQRLSSQHSKNGNDASKLFTDQLSHQSDEENANDSRVSATRKKADHGVQVPKNSRRDLSASEIVSAQEKSKDLKLHFVTDSPSKQSTEQLSHQDLSQDSTSKEISSNMQHQREITHEDVSRSESKVNNPNIVFFETEKEKQVYIESNTHSDHDTGELLMGAAQMPLRRSQRLSLQHSKYDNEISNLFSHQSSHQSDEENANDSRVSATRKKADHGVQVPKNSRRDLSASEKESAQERSKDLRLHIVTDSPSKQSTKQQLHHRDLSKHSMAKEVSSNVQHEREITLEDVSRSETEVNNQSRVISDTDKEKQVHFESNVHSDQEASKSLMGDKQVPKHRSQRLSSQHSKNGNDASKLFTDQLSHQSDEENANDSGVSATRKKVEHGVQIPKNSRRDLSASEIGSAQEKSKDLKLHFVTDSPSKQSTKQQPSHQDLSQDSTAKEISSNMQHQREITHEEVSKSESEVNNQCTEFLEKNEQKQVHFEVNTLSRQEESMSFLEADQASKCRSLRISSQQSKNVDNDVSNLVSDVSLLQGVGENSNESRFNVSEKKGNQRGMIQKNSGKGLSASENMNVEEARKHSVSNVISSTYRSTLQRTLQDLVKSFTTERVSANVNNEREITHEGSVSKLTNRSRVCLESSEKEQSSVRSNIYSGNKDESTSLVKIAQTSKDEVRLKSLDSMNVFISPVIAQGVKRRIIMKQGIADHSKSVPASSITQPGMKLVPSEKHDSKGNSHLTINTSHSSRDVVKSPENISNNKSQPERLRSNMESVFRTHTSTSNKDKYQRETNNESVKDTKSPSARIRTKSSTSQCSFPQSKVIALDSKSESMKNNSNAIGTVISKSKFMSNKFNTLFLEESRPKEDERDILSTTIVENNLGIMSQKLSAVRSHLKRQHEKLTLLQYRKACKQIQTHSANYAKFKKLLAHREKMEDIFNVNDRHSSKNNHVLNIRSQKKDIAEKRSNKETERGASILQYVKSTKFPLRISWGNAVGHPKLTAAVSKNKTSVNRKLKTSDRDVIIIRDVNKAPRIKRPTWLHTRLYKSLSKTVVMKIKDKNVINPQKKSQEIISKLGSLIDKALRYRRKGCNPFVDEVIKHLYHSAIIKTPMNFICFCMRYLPETFIDIALRVKENDSGILGNVIDRDLNL